MHAPPTPADSTDPLVPHDDLAGIAVHDSAGLLTGHIFGVLTEADSGLVRFLDVEIDGKARHVLIPVGHARLEEVLGQKRIRLRAATLDDLEKVPSYHGEPASADLARGLALAYGRMFRGDRYYAHPAFDHERLFAGEHPIVRESDPSELAPVELERLNDSKHYRIAEGETDIRGWPVIDARSAVAGQATDLLIDVKAEMVRYVVVELPGNGNRLLPIGYVDLDRVARHVLVLGLTESDLRALPAFDDLPLTRASEDHLLDQIERALDARNPFLRVDFSGREMVA